MNGNVSDFDTRHRARIAVQLSEKIKPLLAGQGPDVQSAVLADLSSLWLAGMASEVREEMLKTWIATVRDLVPASITEMVSRGLAPAWWR